MRACQLYTTWGGNSTFQLDGTVVPRWQLGLPSVPLAGARPGEVAWTEAFVLRGPVEREALGPERLHGRRFVSCSGRYVWVRMAPPRASLSFVRAPLCLTLRPREGGRALLNAWLLCFTSKDEGSPRVVKPERQESMGICSPSRGFSRDTGGQRTSDSEGRGAAAHSQTQATSHNTNEPVVEG